MSQGTAKYWDSRASSYDALFDRAPIRTRMIEEIGRRSPSDAFAILDLGAGTGRLSQYLLPRYPHSRFFLVDASPAMLAQAQARLAGHTRVRLCVATFDRLPLPDESVDLVLSSFALHHVDNNEKALAAREVYRVLQPGGLAIIVDEIICCQSLVSDRHALHHRMLELFYPEETSESRQALFSQLEEWPTEPATLECIFESANLCVSVETVNEIVGILTARKACS